MTRNYQGIEEILKRKFCISPIYTINEKFKKVYFKNVRKNKKFLEYI